jgi:hypothetical protein
VLLGDSWKERERGLCQAYELVARLHNTLGITEPLPASVSPFHDRPFLTISRGAFSSAIVSQITDKRVQEIANKPLIGGVDQFSDSTDLLSDAGQRLVVRQLY